MVSTKIQQKFNKNDFIDSECMMTVYASWQVRVKLIIVIIFSSSIVQHNVSVWIGMQMQIKMINREFLNLTAMQHFVSPHSKH